MSIRVLHVEVRSASELDDVERFGKNDAYAQVALDLIQKNAFQKTPVRKNSGSNPVWNSNFVLEGVTHSHHSLYVEILESDLGADAPIGFAAIPLDQVDNAKNKKLNGVFQLYTPSGKEKGEIKLGLSLHDDISDITSIDEDVAEVRGRSEIQIEHQKRIKSLKLKETAQDAATTALAAGVLAYGVSTLLGGKKAAPATDRDASQVEQ
ncbi:hypothetical protein BGZ94_002215 [Podila epigama]|nr:hypothetical protein BGZ94_002215 [Podila epigama]